MRRFNGVIVMVLLGYLTCFLTILFFVEHQDESGDKVYLVEVNEIMQELKDADIFRQPDTKQMDYIKNVTFLPAKQMNEASALSVFCRKEAGVNQHTEPLIQGGTVRGLLRFDYVLPIKNKYVDNMVFVVLCLFVSLNVFVLLYVKYKILKPFEIFCEMPVQLAKGKLNEELPESKSRYFGRFTWGISMLRDHLKFSKQKELKLEREKKLLLLSISHDIKTPVNTILLYAKAIRQGMYPTLEKQREVSDQIWRQALEIEGFVTQIVKTSSEELFDIDVQDGEFYLEDLIERIRRYDVPKCLLKQVNLVIAPFGNRLVKGDVDRAYEVVENIMENALKYGDGREVKVRFYEEDSCQLLEIRNTGIPIKNGEMPHLFDSFYRGENAQTREGNGLGLYICREIMRKMGGEIFAEIREDGMSFSLVFR